MTVCRIARNNAEERIKAVLEGKPAPITAIGEDEDEDSVEIPDLEQNAQDQIRDEIGEKFTGHGLARLVSEILKAQGYMTKLSAPGPDGGVDIIAGQGVMGFDSPRLCVQVKSGATAADVSVLRSLQGVLKNFGAEQGLLVSWGGFKTSVVTEARRLYFEIRLWDADDVLAALFETYEKLPEDIKADLPLKRVWVLVPDEGADSS
jgi:restriction system protein